MDINGSRTVSSNQEHTPHDKAAAAEGRRERRKIPVYILAIVGLFLIAILFYMFAGSKPDRTDAPPGHPDASTETTNTNTTAVAEASDTATAVDP
jgi:heme/copper-type cytochrome/quinol oxidase subunit 3